MKKPILALVPSAEKSLKVYSVLPVNGDGDFELRRNGDANRINKDGLIENVLGSDNPRLNWSGECPSLLLEGTSTNLQIRSEEFDIFTWTKTNITVTANDTISPDGTESADKLQRTNTAASYIYDAISIGYGQKTYTNSIFVKKGEGSFLAIRARGSGAWVDLRFNFLTKQIISYTATSIFTAISSKVEEFNNGWFRIHFTYTTDGYNILTHSYSPRYTQGDIDDTDVNNIANCYIWGSQVEEQIYGSSYIKTEGSIATRNKETRVATGLYGDPEFNKNEGVAFIDVKPFPVDASDTNGNIISLVGGTYNQIFFRFKPNVLQFYVNNQPGTAIVFYELAHNGGRIKAAIRWNNGNYSIFANGQLYNSYLNTSRFFTDLETFQFQQSTSLYEFEGEVYGIQVFDEALDNNEIAKLTEL
jgi:hypothetical protein